MTTHSSKVSLPKNLYPVGLMDEQAAQSVERGLFKSPMPKGTLLQSIVALSSMWNVNTVVKHSRTSSHLGATQELPITRTRLLYMRRRNIKSINISQILIFLINLTSPNVENKPEKYNYSISFKIPIYNKKRKSKFQNIMRRF